MDSLSRQKTMDNNCFTIMKHNRKKLWLHLYPCQQKQSGESIDFYRCQIVTKHLSSHQGANRKGQAGNKRKMLPFSLITGRYSRRPVRESGVSGLPNSNEATPTMVSVKLKLPPPTKSNRVLQCQMSLEAKC